MDFTTNGRTSPFDKNLLVIARCKCDCICNFFVGEGGGGSRRERKDSCTAVAALWSCGQQLPQLVWDRWIALHRLIGTGVCVRLPTAERDANSLPNQNFPSKSSQPSWPLPQSRQPDSASVNNLHQKSGGRNLFSAKHCRTFFLCLEKSRPRG